MAQATSNVTMLRPTKPSRRALAYTMPRNELGRFQPLPKVAPRQPTNWAVLYEWRDARLEYAEQLKHAKHEQRWGGLRSIAILSLMSTVLVGMLVAGVLGG